MGEWIGFYAPFFVSREEAGLFAKRFEGLDLEDSNHPAKIMMHQSQRLDTLADDLAQIRTQRESLQLLFLPICAEQISSAPGDARREVAPGKTTCRPAKLIPPNCGYACRFSGTTLAPAFRPSR